MMRALIETGIDQTPPERPEEDTNMTKTLTAALLGAAGLVVLSLPVSAASSTTVTDTARVKSEQMQLAQRPYDPSAGSVGFKKGAQTAQRREDPSAGSVGFKAKKKAMKKKGKKKAKKA
jgi:hypothetical protein